MNNDKFEDINWGGKMYDILSSEERSDLYKAYENWLRSNNCNREEYTILDWCFIEGLLDMNKCRKSLQEQFKQ